MPRGGFKRPEGFGRYDPITHTLFIDQKKANQPPPGVPSSPVALRVGNKGRLHAVLHSNDADVIGMAQKAGVPMEEPLSARHETGRKHAPRAEKFGNGDSHSAQPASRLRKALESGIDADEAQAMGLPPTETFRGRSRPSADPGFYNPLTHDYAMSATPRDWSKSTGRRQPRPGTSTMPCATPLRPTQLHSTPPAWND